jgi:hypothetical protein
MGHIKKMSNAVSVKNFIGRGISLNLPTSSRALGIYNAIAQLYSFNE